MAERKDIPLSNEHFAAWCLQMVSQPYWYGTCCYRAGESLLKKKAKRYPKHYPASRMKRYRQDIARHAVVADCVGACKGYAWTGGGQGIPDSIGTGKPYTSRYGANGCPDKGATGMFRWAKGKGAAWGTVDTLPDVPGLALYKAGHIGYTVGGGEAVEWRGFAWGCVRTRIWDRPWTHWFALPFIDYGEAMPHVQPVLRTLKRGSRGGDVRALQAQLNMLGAGLAVDGVFGRKTQAAVKAFQRKAGLKTDGKVGDQTRAALEAAV